jgi:hypothetical protein
MASLERRRPRCAATEAAAEEELDRTRAASCEEDRASPKLLAGRQFPMLSFLIA